MPIYKLRIYKTRRGFTYLGVLILLAIISLVSTATLQLGVIVQRSAAEEELLAIGAQFRTALDSYAQATPPGLKRAPGTLQELLKDPRFPATRRHLRKVYADPLTGMEDWGIVRTPDGGGIIGVYSRSEEKPIKIGNFNAPFEGFAGKKSYRDWVFLTPTI